MNAVISNCAQWLYCLPALSAQG